MSALAAAAAAAGTAANAAAVTPPAAPPPVAAPPPAAEPKVEAKTGEPKVEPKAEEPKVDPEGGKPFVDLAQLKLPEGVTADPEAMKGFLPLAKELGITAAQASKLIEFSALNGATAAKAQEAARAAAAEKAVAELKGDPDIGGAKLEASMKAAGKVLHKFGGPELAEAIEQMELSDGSMLGDSKVFAKLLVNFSKLLTEDQMGVSAPMKAKTPANSDEAFHRALYPKSPTLKF